MRCLPVHSSLHPGFRHTASIQSMLSPYDQTKTLSLFTCLHIRRLTAAHRVCGSAVVLQPAPTVERAVDSLRARCVGLLRAGGRNCETTSEGAAAPWQSSAEPRLVPTSPREKGPRPCWPHPSTQILAAPQAMQRHTAQRQHRCPAGGPQDKKTKFEFNQHYRNVWALALGIMYICICSQTLSLSLSLSLSL